MMEEILNSRTDPNGAYDLRGGRNPLSWKTETGKFGKKVFKVAAYALAASTFVSANTYAQEELGFSPNASKVYASIDVVSSGLPISLQDATQISRDDVEMAYARQNSNRKSIYETGFPQHLPMIPFLGPDAPPASWVQNPQEHYEQLLQHWGYQFK